jgi:hypothetical protein
MIMRVNVVVLVRSGTPQDVIVFPAWQVEATGRCIEDFKAAVDFEEEVDAVGDFWDIEVQEGWGR